MTSEKLTIRNIRARGVLVPMRMPLRTAGGSVKEAPLALLELITEQGITGQSYVFCYTPLALRPVCDLAESLTAALRGDIVAPVAIEQKLQRMFRLLGPQGLAGLAMAGIDMAAWDALAHACGLPLVSLLGGAPRSVRAYNSRGIGISDPPAAAGEARQLAEGFSAVKVRLGYQSREADVDVLREVRRAVGPGIHIMTDYNQCLAVPDAILRAQALAAEEVYWIEEPVLATDFAGHAQVTRASAVPVQLGENWWGIADMAKSVAAHASSLAMPDASKIGGVTGWLKAAALAEAHGLPVSSHLYPEISAHLLAVTPTCDWLEYVDWAEPVLARPLEIVEGQAKIPSTAGSGVCFDEEAVQRYLVK